MGNDVGNWVVGGGEVCFMGTEEWHILWWNALLDEKWGVGCLEKLRDVSEAV